jgi:ABC-type transport system involved in cytochrome bd biosynthesis fused ATPase/permease subunit
MAENQEATLFRKKAMARISSPEDLTGYLRVTSPGMWIVLAAVIALLVGVFAWSAVGTLETTVNATAIVRSHTAQIVAAGQGEDALRSGMPLRIASQEYVIASVDYDEYGRATAYAEVSLPDGSYDATVVVEQTRPIEFLLESR